MDYTMRGPGSDFDDKQAGFSSEEFEELIMAMLTRRQQSEIAWDQMMKAGATGQAKSYAERLINVYGILSELGLEVGIS